MPASAPTLQIEFVPRGETDADLLLVGGVASIRDALRLRRSLRKAISESRQRFLLVDLHGIQRIEIAAIAMLAEALLCRSGKRPEVLLCGPSESVQRVFRMARLQGLLGRCYSCREEAQRLISADPGKVESLASQSGKEPLDSF